MPTNRKQQLLRDIGLLKKETAKKKKKKETAEFYQPILKIY
jgi:hypothetical protein